MGDSALHPRPQLVRDRWIDLSGEWRFAYDDQDRGRSEGWQQTDQPFDRTIVVPFPPESPLSGLGDPSYHPVVWYRTDFEPPSLRDEERLLLNFGAVDYRASVWLNGHHVGEHEGGHTPFSFDVTDLLDPTTGAQTVVVRADDQPQDFAQPRGKQDWRPEPHGIWYQRTTGIWQPVWLEPVPSTHLAEVDWTAHLPAASVTLNVRLNRRPASPLRLRARLTLADELLTEAEISVGSSGAHCRLDLSALRQGPSFGGLLWSPESPTLLDAEVSLLEGDRTLDAITSYVGLRSVGYRDGRFLLNGTPYYPRLVLDQGYWPGSHLAAPSGEALCREVELVKELGFNGIRIHQKVEDPRFLYWCDRLGLLVWGEMPNAYEFSPEAVRRFVSEWMAVVRRDRSHPCIVAWVPLNESWGVPAIADAADQQHYATALYHLTHALDPTRPVISNDGWEHTESDIWGVHDYAPTGESLRQRYGDRDAVERTLRGTSPGRRRVLLDEPAWRGQPVAITEFGGLSLTPAAGEEWSGYSTVGSEEELLERFAELVTAILDSDQVAGFCYTQLTDTRQERNGLLTEDRTPKLPVDAVRQIVTRPSRAIPAEAVDASRKAARSGR